MTEPAPASAPPAPQLSILRIKRKRTLQPAPLEALLIEQAQQPSAKRRRRDRPTDAPPPLAAPARGIFRFAETVPLDSFSTPTKSRSLRDRIQSFLAHPPPALSRQASSSSLRASAAAAPSSSAPASPRTGPPGTTSTGRKLPSALRAARSAAAAPANAASSSAASSAPCSPGLSPHALTFGLDGRAGSRSREGGGGGASSTGAAHALRTRADAVHADRALLRYRIVERRRADAAEAAAAREQRAREVEEDEVRRGLRPPQVLDSREVAAAAAAGERAGEEEEQGDSEAEDAGWRIYEAVAVADPAAGASAVPTPRTVAASTTRVPRGGDLRSTQEELRRRGPGAAASVSTRVVDGEGDDAMDRFGEMLDEYLSLQETITPSAGPAAGVTASGRKNTEPPARRVPAGSDSDSDSDAESDASFVYDVYYRAAPAPAPGPAPPAAAASAANPAAAVTAEEGGRVPSSRTFTGASSSETRSVPLSEEVRGNGNGAWDVGSLAGLTRIGQLAGLEEDEDDAAWVLFHTTAGGLPGGVGGGVGGAGAGESDDDEEEEDHADQDSNEENDYRNDYPDEEEDDDEDGDEQLVDDEGGGKASSGTRRVYDLDDPAAWRDTLRGMADRGGRGLQRGTSGWTDEDEEEDEEEEGEDEEEDDEWSD